MAIGDFGGMMNNAADSLTADSQNKAKKELDELKKKVEYELRLQMDAAKKLQEYKKKVEAGTIKDNEKVRSKLEKDAEQQKKAEAKKRLNEEAKIKRDLEKQILEESGKLFQAKLKGITNSVKDNLTNLEKLGGGSIVKGYFKQAGIYMADAIGNAAKAVYGQLTKGVDDAMQMFSARQSRINARLQGSRGSEVNIFQNINKTLEKNVAASPYLKYGDVLSSIDTLVDSGVAYNLEQRAFLMTISDKIATTFDAANSTLLQIIRIQQEDSTAARLGMQATLTNFLNTNFNDTTYMKMYDTIAGTIADSVVQLGTRGGAEYEYAVQKWLGSLTSVGVGSSTINALAQALNQLGTGDVGALSGSAMQNLIVMALNKVGGSYGDILTGGLSSGGVNQLFQGILSVWSDIASTNNQVVRKQYADLFGLSMSDLVAITNLSKSDIAGITGSNLSYAGALGETNRQLGLVGSRMHVSELIQNAYENALAGIGRNIANSPGMMATWLINNMIEDATGGINIPVVGALGSFVDFKANLNQLARLGMVGVSTLGQIGNIIDSISNSGGLNLASWGGSQYNRIGGGTQGVISGVAFDTSTTTFIGNASGSDIYTSTLNAARDQATERGVITNVQDQTDKASKVNDAILDSIEPKLAAILTILRDESIRVRVENYGLTNSVVG